MKKPQDYLESTLSYYDRAAQSGVDLPNPIQRSSLYQRFMEFVPTGSRVLDVGCGYGIDSAFFLSKGFKVDAVDASGEMVKHASQHLGKGVVQQCMEHLAPKTQYDGIWTHASLHHLPEPVLSRVVEKLFGCLKAGATWFLSFPAGRGAFYDEEGCYINYQSPKSLRRLLEGFPSCEIMEIWTENSWTLAIVQKRKQNATPCPLCDLGQAVHEGLYWRSIGLGDGDRFVCVTREHYRDWFSCPRSVQDALPGFLAETRRLLGLGQSETPYEIRIDPGCMDHCHVEVLPKQSPSVLKVSANLKKDLHLNAC